MLWKRLAAGGATGNPWRRAVRGAASNVVFAPTEVSFATYDVPLVLALRNCLVFDRHAAALLSPKGRAKISLQWGFARASSRAAAAYVAVSQYAATAAISSLKLAPAKVHVIYHGGPTVGSPRDLTPAQRFLFVGSLARHKNLHGLLQVLPAVSGDWSLDVAGTTGTDSYSNSLRQMITSRNLERKVRFWGHCSTTQLRGLYLSSDCLVWPSLAETFGHPLLEAHARGLPIIASRVCCHEEIAGSAAHYYEPGEPRELIALLRTAIATGLTVGRLPRTYDWDETGARLEQLLVTIVGR